MKLKNPFTKDTRVLFIDHQYCMDCGSNQMPELHHICGRKSSSPLNAIVLCKKCHDHVGHHEEEEKKYFKITLIFLLQIEYQFTEADQDFINSYKRLKDCIYDN